MSLPRFELRKAEDYKTLHASGAIVTLNPNEATIIFFVEKPIPKVNPDGSMTIETVERELLVEIKLSPVGMKSLALALLNNLQSFEKRFGEIKVPTVPEKKEREFSI
ncbi:MAG: DUF3467 domain-containing protein [Sulfolobales archaeon]